MNLNKQRFQNWVISSLLACSFLSSAQANDLFPQSSRAIAIDAMNDSSSEHNWLFSPLSASSCLSMVYAGSSGRTALELSEALHLPVDQDLIGIAFHTFFHDLVHCPSTTTDFKLRIVHGIWSQADFPFLDPFISSMRENFGAEIDSINFSLSSLDQINGWISDQTEHKIQNLFNASDIDSATKLVLANAFYFKGCWLNLFHPNATTNSPFAVSKTVTREVKMMQQSTHFQYFEDSDWQAVILPFAKDQSAHAEPACLFLLPKQREIVPRLTCAKLEQILTSTQRRMVHLNVPRFKIEQRFDLQGLLQHRGVRDSFSTLADFSKMDGRNDLYLSKVVQKCFFSMDEKGVEAAAATGAVMNLKCCGLAEDDPVTFIADRPFVFMLIDQTSKTCLMVGHVADPLE